MSFFNSNQHFVTQRLMVDFRGLNQEESIIRYDGLKSKVHEKLREYYSKVEDKLTFYTEIIELLGKRDGEYILLNLFFEKDVDFIIMGLKRNDSINSIKCFDSESLSFNILSEIKKNSNFQIVFFLKEYFTALIDLSEADWKNENENIHPLVRAFAKWLAENSDRKANEFELGVLLFEKIWSFYFSTPFNNLKALIFVSVLINEIKKNSIPIHRNLDRVRATIRELFVIRSHSILLDDTNLKNELSTGYIKNRLELEKLLDNSRSKDKDFQSWTFIEIFEAFDKMNIPDKEKALKDLRLKIDSGEIPTGADLTSLSSVSESKEVMNMINQKCYFFDKLEL